MPIDAWFPLVVYFVDLEESATQKEPLIRRIDELQQGAGAQRTSSNSAWTGDIHNVERIHSDPAFDWLTGQVGYHALEYLKTTGHDLDKIDVYIQRSWPVLAGKSQRVARHAHHNAHLSAVYYVSAPPKEQGGALRFFNEARPNEVCAGIGSGMTGAYREYNFTNYGSAEYAAVEGRLLIFPAKQSHDVEAHESDQPRVSLSYDLVLTSREEASPGLYEFLMPPPSAWKRVARRTADNPDAVPSA
jgi:uncharacterized protein (TIGR02466 family)